MAATSLYAKVRGGVYVSLTGDADLGSDSILIPFPADRTLSLGTAADQVDLVWADRRTLAASANEELDLAGALKTLGTNQVFSKVRCLYVAALPANTHVVVVGGAAANAWAAPFGAANDEVKVVPGGFVMLFAPNLAAYAVTAGTGDLLKIANGGGASSVTYDIIVLGASA